MNNNIWKNIWNKKSVDDISIDNYSEYSIFCKLKKANGYDVAVDDEEMYYKSFYDEWGQLYKKMVDLVGSIGSVYEVGCGSGVNLYMFSQKGITNNGGIDYAENLINSARRFGENDDFLCGEAIDVSIEPRYDLVMSEGVFEYFPSLDYAGIVLSKMLEKSRKLVYIGGYGILLKEMR